MRRLAICTTSCALLLALLLPFSAQAQTYETGVRGVWITNVSSDVLNSKEKIAEAMAYLKSRGFNVVFPVVLNKGYTLHPSAVMATTIGEAYRQDPFFAGQQRDPLAEIITEARRVGLEVIPWFEFGFSSSFSQDGGHIIAAKPHWAAKDVNGNLVVKNGFDWMDALNPEVQDFMTALVLEVVDNYDVDGIQGDDRLPAMPSEGGYTDYDIALYKSEHGGATPPSFSKDNDWLIWRAGKLTNYLGRLYRTIKARDENLLVSMSPSPYSFGFVEYLQNVPRWVDSSYVDLLHPQLYRYNVGDYKQLVRQTVGPTPTSGGGYVPMDKRHLLSPGILTRGGGGINGPDYLVEAVRYNREFGITGEVFFFYEYLREKNQFAADSLFKYHYHTPALLPGRDGLRRPPARVVNETDGAATLSGDWTEDDRAPGFDGFMRFAPPGTGSTATYALAASYTGTYDLYAFVPRFRSGSTTDAYYVAHNAAGDSVVARVDQRSTYNQGFVFLGTLSAAAGTTVTLTLRPDQVTDSRATYADAVMMVLNRKETPGLVIPVGAERTALPVPAGDPFSLDVVAPNPSGGTAQLTFTLHAPALVTARVYDALGRTVQTLAAGQAFTAGTHSLETDLSGQAAGVYFIRLQAGGKGRTTTLVLAR